MARTLEELLKVLNARSASDVETGPLPAVGSSSTLEAARAEAKSKEGKFAAKNMINRNACLVTEEEMNLLLGEGALHVNLGARDAINRALESASEILLLPRGELRLEEVTRNERENQWQITISYFVTDETPQPTKLFKSVLSEPRRVERLYKVVAIDRKTGDFMGMKRHGT